MDMTQCSIGHFYDSDEYDSCPFCQSALSEPDFDTESQFDRFSFRKSYEQSHSRRHSSAQTDWSTGRARFSSSSGQSIFLDPEPETQKVKLVVGWLVALEGECRGRSFELYDETVTIGRSSSNRICLPNEPTVSRCAASVGFDSRSCTFYCLPQPGSSSLTFVNNQPLIQHVALREGDIIQLGKSKLVLVPFCTKEFHW